MLSRRSESLARGGGSSSSRSRRRRLRCGRLNLHAAGTHQWPQRLRPKRSSLDCSASRSRQRAIVSRHLNQGVIEKARVSITPCLNPIRALHNSVSPFLALARRCCKLNHCSTTATAELHEGQRRDRLDPAEVSVDPSTSG